MTDDSQSANKRLFLLSKLNILFNDQDSVLILMQDITNIIEKKEVDEGMRRLLNLHSVVVHELNSPLTLISELSRALKSSLKTQHNESIDLCDSINSCAKLISCRIKDLIDNKLMHTGEL